MENKRRNDQSTERTAHSKVRDSRSLRSNALAKENVNRPGGCGERGPFHASEGARIGQVKAQTANGNNPSHRQNCGNSWADSSASDNGNNNGANELH